MITSSYIIDGNNNVIALKDSSGADVSTYTPFGALEKPADGDENPFRFSSEYADDETGFISFTTTNCGTRQYMNTCKLYEGDVR